MALTAQSIASRAAMIIQDLTNVRWPLSELANWLNDARRELAIVRPDIYAKTEGTYPLTAAGAKQTLPDDGLRLLDIPKNAGPTGSAVTITQRGFLDQQNRDWHAMPTSGVTAIKHFMLDERDPATFWVYPPVSANAVSVTIIYLARPTDFAISSGEISGSLNEYESLYGGALTDYICYRAFSKDSEYAGNAQRALAHYQQFQNALGIGHKNDLTYSANLANVGGVPSKQLATGG